MPYFSTPTRRSGPRLVALVAMCVCIVNANASAQSSPSPRATAASSAAAAFCPLSPDVRELDETHRLYALSFRSFGTRRAEAPRRVSGTVALWAGNRRFDVPFRDVLALDSSDRVSPETSITVRFAAPATLDGAVVTAIDEDGARRSCEPWFGPWMPRPPATVPDRRTAEERSTEQRFVARARAAAPIDAPAAVADPKACATPDRPGRTVYVAQVETPGVSGGGYSVVQVLLDPSDKIVSTRIDSPSGSAALDFAALAAARRSEYQGVFFRCRHVMGAYLFSVEFPAG